MIPLRPDPVEFLTGRHSGTDRPGGVSMPGDGGKFTPDGHALIWPGNTFICHINRKSPQWAVGKIVRMSLFNRFDFRFFVSGVMKPKGGEGDDDFSVFIPVSTMQNRIAFLKNPTGDVDVFRILVRSEDEYDKSIVSNLLSENLKEIHGVVEPDFEITSMDQLLEAANQVSGALTLFLGSIAGISLLVGAIGVGNIMLVSVTERTREIGTLRSIGATKSDIRLQFITEALTICLLGGLLGIIIGIIISLNLSGISFEEDDNLTPVISLSSVLLAFVVSFLVGLISPSLFQWMHREKL